MCGGCVQQLLGVVEDAEEPVVGCCEKVTVLSISVECGIIRRGAA